MSTRPHPGPLLLTCALLAWGALGYDTGVALAQESCPAPPSFGRPGATGDGCLDRLRCDTSTRTLSAGARQTCRVVDGAVECWGKEWGRRDLHCPDAGMVGLDYTRDRIEACCGSGNCRPDCLPGESCQRGVPQTSTNSNTCGCNSVSDAWMGAGPTEHDARASTDVVQIAVGYEMLCSLSAAGVVRCQGDPLTQPPNLSEIASMDAGYSHACAVGPSGDVTCWGANAWGQLGAWGVSVEGMVVPGLYDILQVSAGHGHTCALHASGEVVCWGSNHYGQLGVETESVYAGPCSLVTLPNAAEQVEAGGHHTCALTRGGAVWCWGNNRYGQLGAGSTARSDTPVQAPLPQRAVRLSAGGYHTCALGEGGEVWCWGKGQPGGLAQVALPDAAEEVAAGYEHTCARLRNGETWCWGRNAFGQLGDGTWQDRRVPTRVSEISGPCRTFCAAVMEACSAGTVLEVYADRDACEAACLDMERDTTGTTYGDTLECRLSYLTNLKEQPESYCAAMAPAPSCLCGEEPGGPCSCESGFLDCNGRLADGCEAPLFTDEAHCGGCGVACGDGERCVQGGCQREDGSLSAGAAHTCAVRKGGGVACWGDNTDGQLGAALDADGPVPVELEGAATQVASGDRFSCALLEGDALSCWGVLAEGDAPLPPTPVLINGQVVPLVGVAAHRGVVCGRMQGGALLCLGDNTHGQVAPSPDAMIEGVGVISAFQGTPAAGTPAQIAIGDRVTCTLDVDGVTCWGGQTDDEGAALPHSPWRVHGSALARAVAVGDTLACLIDDAQAVQCWEADAPTPTLEPVSGDWEGAPVALALSATTRCVVTDAGEAWCWGDGALETTGAEDPDLPARIPGLDGTPIERVTLGDGHACALERDGDGIWCWGDNAAGQLGHRDHEQQPLPAPVEGLGAP